MADQIDIIVADLNAFTRLEVIQLATNIDANLRESPPLGTPVDTGWARANWVPSLNQPFNGAANAKDPTPAQIAERANEAQQGLNEVLQWKNGDGPIFVTNRVPYIEALNAGHSKQSPAAFVQYAIEKAVSETYSAGASKAARFRRADAARAAAGKPIRRTGK